MGPGGTLLPLHFESLATFIYRAPHMPLKPIRHLRALLPTLGHLILPLKYKQYLLIRK